jgi:hydrogenase maturation protease
MLVIGVGNPDRGDDAVGWWVIEHLDGRCDTVRSAGDPAGLIGAWRGRSRVVVVDATRRGVPPGTVWTVDLLQEELPSGGVRSTHGLGPVQAVELARALGDLPRELTLVGIEGLSWGHGAELTEPVRAGAYRAIELIATWLENGVAAKDCRDEPA